MQGTPRDPPREPQGVKVVSLVGKLYFCSMLLFTFELKKAFIHFVFCLFGSELHGKRWGAWRPMQVWRLSCATVGRVSLPWSWILTLWVEGLLHAPFSSWGQEAIAAIEGREHSTLYFDVELVTQCGDGIDRDLLADVVLGANEFDEPLLFMLKLPALCSSSSEDEHAVINCS